MKQAITRDLKDIKRIIKDYYKQLHTHKFYIKWNGPIPHKEKLPVKIH